MAKNIEELVLSPRGGSLQIDLSEASTVNVQTAADGRLWICVDGVNIVRIRKCKEFTTDLAPARYAKKQSAAKE